MGFLEGVKLNHKNRSIGKLSIDVPNLVTTNFKKNWSYHTLCKIYSVTSYVCTFLYNSFTINEYDVDCTIKDDKVNSFVMIRQVIKVSDDYQVLGQTFCSLIS